MEKKKDYSKELDFAKGVLIILMVLFHLQYIEENYQNIYKATYAFHMAGFLVISGYLCNINKKPSLFTKDMLRIIIPYLIFELLYLLGVYFLSSILNSHVRLDSISGWSILRHLFLAPIGTYWYLHTLIICMSVYYISVRVLNLLPVKGFIIFATSIYILTIFIEGFSWSNAIFFIIGAFINGLGLNIIKAIPSTWVTIIPLTILFSLNNNITSGSLASIAITLLVLGLLFWLYYIGKTQINRFFVWLGKNTISIVVFSPFFTVTSKLFLNTLLSIDQTGIIFAIVAILYVIVGSIIISKICDIMHLSKYIFRREQLYINF